MSGPRYHVLLYGVQKINPKEIMNSAAYTLIQPAMTSIADNIFLLNNFQALIIYAGTENAAELAGRFHLHAPGLPVILLTDTPDPTLLEQKDLLWYADPSDKNTFFYSLCLLWRFLEQILNQKMGADGKGNYIVGGGVLSFSDGVYIKNGESAPLPLKQLELLKLLVEKRGQIVSRTEIMDKIWRKSKPVGERIIDTNMVALRKIFGDEGRSPHIIQTCHGQGYRLSAEQPSVFLEE